MSVPITPLALSGPLPPLFHTPSPQQPRSVEHLYLYDPIDFFKSHTQNPIHFLFNTEKWIQIMKHKLYPFFFLRNFQFNYLP